MSGAVQGGETLVGHIDRQTAIVKPLVSSLVDAGIPFREFKSWAERVYLLEVLDKAHWNQSKAARIAGVHRNTFTRQMAEHNIVSRNVRAKERREQRRRDLGLRG